jgi:hypothetical protein
MASCLDGPRPCDGLVDWPDDPARKDASFSRANAHCQDCASSDGSTVIDFGAGAAVNGRVSPDVADPPCVDRPWFNKETAVSCGLGAEPAFAMGALARAPRRRMRWMNVWISRVHRRRA